MRTLCGHLEDPVEVRESDGRWSEIAGVLETHDDGLDLRRFAPPVCEQIANDCCGVAVRASAYACALANDAAIALPSCLALYAGAQLMAGIKPPLPDTGSSLRAMLRWTAINGLASEYRWPETPENVGVVPPADVFQKGQDAPILAWHSLDLGSKLSDGLISALQRKRFPVIAMPVDEGFASIADGVYTGPAGRPLGFHAMMVAGYLTELDAFVLQNSWGQDFGDRGFAYVARDTLNRRATDALVIDAVPRGAA